MIVYIVTSGAYSDYGIEHVFLDKELADQYVTSRNSSRDYGYDKAHVEEWNVTTKLDVPVPGLQFSMDMWINSATGEVLDSHESARPRLLPRNSLKKVHSDVIDDVTYTGGIRATRILVIGAEEAGVRKVLAEKVGEVRSRYLPGPKPEEA